MSLVPESSRLGEGSTSSDPILLTPVSRVRHPRQVVGIVLWNASDLVDKARDIINNQPAISSVEELKVSSARRVVNAFGNPWVIAGLMHSDVNIVRQGALVYRDRFAGVASHILEALCGPGRRPQLHMMSKVHILECGARL